MAGPDAETPFQGEPPNAPHAAHPNGLADRSVENEKSSSQAPAGAASASDAAAQDSSRANASRDGDHAAKEEDPQVARQPTLKEKLTHKADKVKQKANPAGGFDTTPIPDAPPGFTIKFTFHKAENLPVADYGTGSADPFLTATLTTPLPRRHKEDPDLVHRTRTIRQSLEPAWNEEWIVANIPSTGFKLKCRLYDEDWPDSNDRLGNVTIVASDINENWSGIALDGKPFEVEKRMGSKRAYLLKACTSAFSSEKNMTPLLYVRAELMGRSTPPYGHLHTVGPTYFFKHFSPMIGRMTGIKVNRDENADSQENSEPATRGTTKYDFQANELQLAGPVPPKLYHRFVEFSPFIGLLFRNRGFRGRVLHTALHTQHERIYNFDKSTEYGTFEPCSEEASLQFLRLAHFDEGARVFTYVITLDGLMRFTETGKEFGIDLLSKHTMHSDAAAYIACSGEFLIRRLKRPSASDSPEPDQPTHPDDDLEGGPPNEAPPSSPEYYQLVIDNDSGTYRPDKSVLPELHEYLTRNFPGLGIVTLACDDPKCQKLKQNQREARKKEGHTVNMVLNRSPSASSLSSDDLSDLDEMDRAGGAGRKGKLDRGIDLLEDPSRFREMTKDAFGRTVPASPAAPGEAEAGPSRSRGADGGS